VRVRVYACIYIYIYVYILFGKVITSVEVRRLLSCANRG
jgi:hypothetical protein